MIVVALIAGTLLLVAAGALRAAMASAQATPRADALHDAAEGRRGADRVAALMEDRRLLAEAVGVTHAGLMVASAVPAAWAMTRLTGGPALAAALVIVGLVVLILGDVAPRAIGRARPGGLAYRLAPLLAAARRTGEPAAQLVPDRSEPVTVEEETDEDDHDHEELELISSVLQFSETIVREVMVPRPDMVVVESGASIQQLMSLVDAHGLSRIPVVSESGEDVVGLVIVKDLLPRLANGNRPRAVADVMRPIDFVPETKRVSDLLREMQASKSHLAIVVDEYGATAGLVTIEDLLEELVGEIVDEYDEDEVLFAEQADGTWMVDGRLSVADLSELVGVELPDGEWDTVGGLVLDLAGRVPVEGESFEVGPVVLTVTRVQGRRVAEVTLSLPVDATLEDAG